MKITDFLFVLAGVLLNAVAQLLLKSGANAVGPIHGVEGLRGVALTLAFHPGVIGGLFCYALSVVIWVIALSRVDVSIAYPMLSIGYVVNALLAMALLGEVISLQRWIGMGVILAGVALIART
ncbi:MAG: EamA family transporter [Curvibacter sp.]|nr:EamA family transporter [Curvibacter sp.]